MWHLVMWHIMSSNMCFIHPLLSLFIHSSSIDSSSIHPSMVICPHIQPSFIHPLTPSSLLFSGFLCCCWIWRNITLSSILHTMWPPAQKKTGNLIQPPCAVTAIQKDSLSVISTCQVFSVMCRTIHMKRQSVYTYLSECTCGVFSGDVFGACKEQLFKHFYPVLESEQTETFCTAAFYSQFRFHSNSME